MNKSNKLTSERLKNIICLNGVDDKFNSPVFIFDNSQNCEWFKKQLLRELDVPLFNLKICTIEDFVISYLLDGDKKIKFLDSEIIRDSICKILISEVDGKKYYEVMAEKGDAGWQSVRTFIESHTIVDADNSKINYINLYDLAKTLAKLFKDYTLNYLNDNTYLNDFFSESEKNSSKDGKEDNLWQIELFKKVISESNISASESGFEYGVLYNFFIQKVEKNQLPLLKSNVYYFSQNILENNKSNNFRITNFYKSVLKKIEKEHFDKTTKLFEYSINDLEICLGTNDEAKAASKEMSEKLIRLISAPSKIREIEGVHSEICNLIKNKKVKNFDDILILAPNASEYKTALHQVFSITKGVNNSLYPYIPINLADIRTESDLSTGLKVIFRVTEKGYYTRKDFFDLANSTLVKEKFAISQEGIEVFENLVDKLSVYRNRNSKPDDWQNALYRVLLYTLMDNRKVNDSENQFEDVEYYPKNSNAINPFWVIGATNDIIASFSSLIIWLENWTKYFQEKNIKNIYKFSYNNAEINDLMLMLAELFDISKKINDDDIKGEVFAYRSLMSKINSLNQIYKDSLIPHQVLKLTLFDSISEILIDDGLSAQGGVRVSSISLDSVVCCKYLFLIGMSSANFSIQKNENVLDIRGENFAKISQNLKVNNFKTQIEMCEGFCVSFVDKNLKKDEDFYLAPEISSLLDEENIKGKTIKLLIDENRDDNNLWTAREFRSRTQAEDDNLSGEIKFEIADFEKAQLPRIPIKFSDIKKFLTDPFQFRSKELFGEKWGGNVQKDIFEPVEFDNIVNSNAIKEIIRLKINDENVSDDYIKDRVKKTCVNLPDGKFFDVALNDAVLNANKFYARIANLKSEIVVDKPIDWSLVIGEGEVRIKGVLSIYNKNWIDDNDKVLNVFDYSSDPLNSYITALYLISSNKESLGNQVKIKANLHYKDDSKVYTFEATADNATELLQNIINKMYVEKYSKCLPYKIVADDWSEVCKYTFMKYVEKLNDGFHGPWGFFDNKNLFDAERDCGFSEDSFKNQNEKENEWVREANSQRKLFLYLPTNN